MFSKIFKSFIAVVLLTFALVPVQATDYYHVNVGYQGQNDGIWTDFAYGGALAGTEGGDPLDSLEIHLVDSPYASGVEYRVYTTSGWSEWFSTWQRASHNNEDILGLQIQLKDFPNANVYYQSYRKGLGWGIWVSNGSTSGQLNSAYPITGFRVKVDEIGVNYQSSIGGVTQVLRHNGETQGNGSALETVSMNLISADSGSIEYRAYLRNTGWTNWVSNGAVLGSSSSVIEALEAKLIDLPQYSVQIQPQVEGEWWGYVYDGQTAGSIGSRLTGYRVEIVQRVYIAPTAVVVVETPAVEEGSILGQSTNVTSFLYDINPTSDPDEDFDDDAANRDIVVSDRFKDIMYLNTFVPSNMISVSDNFSNYGDDKVHNGQFEVYSGSYDTNTSIFTVVGTRDNSNENGNYTLLLYDNDTTYNANYLGSILVSGNYKESNWWVDGLYGARVLRYSPVVFDNDDASAYNYPNNKMVADVTFAERDTFTGLTLKTATEFSTGVATDATYNILSTDAKVSDKEYVLLYGNYVSGTFTVSSTPDGQTGLDTAIIYDYDDSSNSYSRNINGYVIENITMQGQYFTIENGLTENAVIKYAS